MGEAAFIGKLLLTYWINAVGFGGISHLLRLLQPLFLPFQAASSAQFRMPGSSPSNFCARIRVDVRIGDGDLKRDHLDPAPGGFVLRCHRGLSFAASQDSYHVGENSQKSSRMRRALTCSPPVSIFTSASANCLPFSTSMVQTKAFPEEESESSVWVLLASLDKRKLGRAGLHGIVPEHGPDGIQEDALAVLPLAVEK